EGEINSIFRPDTKAPQSIAPHLADPVPVLHTVQYADRSTSRSARSEVITDGVDRISGYQIAKHRFFHQRVHPLFPGHKGYATDIIQDFELLRLETGGIKFAMVKW